MNDEQHPKRIKGMSPNQVVAYNLWRARYLRGLTQEKAAARLEPYLGVRWSKATFSAAERSMFGGRVRNFTADDIVAFAQAFDLPIPWFFMPPDGEPEGLDPQEGRQLRRPFVTVTANPEGARPGDELHAADLLDLLFNLDEDAEDLAHRLALALHDVPEPRRTEVQKRAARYADELVLKLAAERWRDVHDQLDALLDVASFVDKVERAVRAEVFDQAVEEGENVSIWRLRALLDAKREAES